MKKYNYILIVLVSFCLTLAIGYALFSKVLTINGTATAQGTFDVEFTSVNNPICVGLSSSCTKENLTQISTDKNAVTITVNKLEYPGSYVEIPIIITNKGTIPAKLVSIDELGLVENNRAIKVTYSGITPSNDNSNSLEQNDTQKVVVRVEWDSTINSDAENVEFTIKLNYEQITA